MLDQKKFNELKSYFDNYTKRFYNNEDDQKAIDLKYHHSYRVYENINKLANNIGLAEKEIVIANVIGLFHDLGRFEQYKKYKTFSDSISINHAELSVEILKEKNIFHNLNKGSQNIIYQAILHHNKIDIPENLSEEELLFSKLIRDADKLDIWNIFAERYHRQENNDKINLNLTEEGIISPEILQLILEEKTVKYSSLKTIDDFKIVQMGWIYNLNFKESFIIVKKRQYIEKIYHSIKSKEAKKVFDNINEYMYKKISD
ncbi:HD domain-containing protein [Natronospora cellulosivora (SeqCode)]